jgi:predicted 3-demethylubiquinone-9 3-methyltransferase (glyoxalase superfamily)
MQKISPCLWFEKDCEKAINYYIDVFNWAPGKTAESKIIDLQRYEKGMNTPNNDEMEGKVLTVYFELNGQNFIALDGGPIFKFNEAISLTVDCRDQEEVDYFWEKLSADPMGGQCGWTKDIFGVSWQIVPRRLVELFEMEDKVKRHKVMNVMLEMKKLNIDELERASMD